MIKAQAKICGVIAQGAVVRQLKDGGVFLSFLLKTVIPPSRKQGEGLTVYVSVTTDGNEEDAAFFAAGKRVEADGTLSFRKTSDHLYLNFKAKAVTEAEGKEDAIQGTLEFKGTVGKDVEEKTTAQGIPYYSFSAFSTEKIGEEFQFTWARFVKFGASKPDLVVPKAKIEAKGVLEVTAYTARPTVSCRLEEVKVWERQPFVAENSNNATDQSLPF